MGYRRATSDFDLHLELPGRGVRKSIEEALRSAIQQGRLRPGQALPSSRTLARDLGVGRNAVAEAYGQLVAEGWLAARQGSRTYVVGVQEAPPTTVPPTLPSRPAPLTYDLRPGWPDLSTFPAQEWLAAARRALASAPSGALGYDVTSRGRIELRQALAAYLSRARGVRAHADQVIICAGATQGFRLVCQVLRSRGATTVAIEEHSLWVHWNTMRMQGLRISVLPVDEYGAHIGDLTGEDAVLLTPSHQFPMGMTLEDNRRAQAVGWAQARRGFIVEDDYDGEFRYDHRAVGALQALLPDRVIYLGSASKSLAPGLRLGWMVVPPELVDELAGLHSIQDGHTSSLEQLTLAEFIASGQYDHHIRRRRLAYRTRRDMLVRSRPTGLPVTGAKAGLHAVASLPRALSEIQVIERAAEHGLSLEGLGTYTLPGDARHPPALVVGYATPTDHGFATALETLRRVVR